MQTNWAEENLQTIRTLMERSAMYRRALAPIVIFAGIMGILAAAAGLIFHLDSALAFGGLWLGTAAVVVTGAFFNTRRQAIKDGEAIWSPPTKRVAQALLPPLTVGLILGIMDLLSDEGKVSDFSVFMWAIFYGCALHSAGFFVARGLKWFGWLYISLSIVILIIYGIADISWFTDPHLLMGFFFGVLHLVYGTYLYLTERGKNAA